MDELAENLENTFASVQRGEKEETAKKMVSWTKKDEYFFNPLVNETSMN